MDDFSEWIGRTEVADEDLNVATAQAAAATFGDNPAEFSKDSRLPPLWHWFYFLPKVPQDRLGNDGHPQREAGSFMPPVPYPRRMFAGAQLRWLRPLRLGRPARREATIQSITEKSGRSGQLAFVTVSYQYFQDNAVCVEETQDIVYREPGPSLSPPEVTELGPLPEGTWSRTIVPDTRLLFRFSALTFNAHRIHYDRPYATNEEGYPGLVVHGPLTAILLLRLVHEHSQQTISSFRLQGRAPIFDMFPFRLLGKRNNNKVELEAQGPDGRAAMLGTAVLR